MDSPLRESTTVAFSRQHEPSIYVPKAFPDDNDKEPTWVFKAFELRYLDAIHRGLSHEKAAEAAELKPDQAERILGRKKAKEYLADLLRQKMAANGMSQEWFLSELRKVWDGNKPKTREQMEAIKEIGARIAPKPDRTGSGSNAPIITINVTAAQAAIKRQEVIDAQIVNGPVNGSNGSAGNISAGV